MTRTKEPLSRESILTAAMALADAEGATQLSLNRLGRELGVDATAIYRHYRDKDELMLALGDRLIGEAMSRVRRRKTWHSTLEGIAMRMRETFLARPALAQQVAARFTGGTGEAALVDRVEEALNDAGLTGRALAHQCRAFVEMVLGHITLTATLLSQPLDAQARDVQTGLRLYGAANAWGLRSRESVPSAREDEDAVFRLVLANYVAGLRASRGRD